MSRHWRVPCSERFCRHIDSVHRGIRQLFGERDGNCAATSADVEDARRRQTRLVRGRCYRLFSDRLSGDHGFNVARLDPRPVDPGEHRVDQMLSLEAAGDQHVTIDRKRPPVELARAQNVRHRLVRGATLYESAIRVALRIL